MNEYLNSLQKVLDDLQEEIGKIKDAAAIVAEAVKNDRLVHVFGTEQMASGLVADLFFRAGQLVNLDPMLDPTLDPAHGAYRNAMCMEIEGLSPCILDYYERVEKGDPIIFIGSDSALPMFRQGLEWAKSKGLATIAILCDGCSSDALVTVSNHTAMEEADQYTAATSAVLNVLIREVKSLLEEDEKYVWTGKRFVDLEKNSEKIDANLFRVRHL